jgi:RNA polymerase sigma factor (TIGR02999 family)
MATGVTELLSRVRLGDTAAFEQLIPMVYDHLHRIAQGCMRGERASHTLQATSLVNEAWIRLAGQNHPDYRDRTQFFGIAARLMRQILVDHARATKAVKRGSGEKVQLDERIDIGGSTPEPVPILAINDALDRLAAEDERRAQLIELRFFAGMTIEEIVDYTGISRPTVYRELRVAQAWLRREIDGTPPAE